MVRPCSRSTSKPSWRRGTEGKGACHVPDTQQQDRRDRHRYQQEFVPHRGRGSAWSPGTAPEVVAWPGGSPGRQSAAVPDRHGGLHRGASSQSAMVSASARCPMPGSGRTTVTSRWWPTFAKAKYVMADRELGPEHRFRSVHGKALCMSQRSPLLIGTCGTGTCGERENPGTPRCCGRDFLRIGRPTAARQRRA